MKVPCTHCCQSGKCISYTGYPSSVSTPVSSRLPYVIADCRFCRGTGWIDDEEEMIIPRKFIKDEYFKS